VSGVSKTHLTSELSNLCKPVSTNGGSGDKLPGQRINTQIKMNEQHIIHKVEKAIQVHDMFQPNDAVLAGVSGGPDSMALLYVLIKIAPRWNLTIGVAHLDHGLRGAESKHDAKFVSALCKKLHLPFYTQTQDVAALQKRNKVSIEMAGRHARYRFYDQTAEKQNFNKIALGHHADDNAELILMNLLRGSGPLGIAGIPPVRDRQYVRPLIYLRRDEILYFLKKNKIEYLSDPSNTDRRFLRNRIRHELLPILAEHYNPRIADALNRYALIARTEEDWLNKQARSVFTKIAEISTDRVKIPIDALKDIHMALLRRVIRKAIKNIKGDMKKITYEHIHMVHHLIHTGSEGDHADLPDRLAAERNQNHLLIFRRASSSPDKKSEKSTSVPRFQYLIDDPKSGPQLLLIRETGLQIRWSTAPRDDLNLQTNIGHQTACFDMDKINWPIIVRNFLPGDRFHPLGMTGSQKLKKYFINKKIPRDKRRHIPILLNKGEIIWIAGHRMGESAKLTDKTQNILKIELLLA
jgi:tRNA(Ile)-lysidine synthase